jgi:beta-lactamase regulating signal transducer with metallopeptidase domain/biopolymer transport protein ExbD
MTELIQRLNDFAPQWADSMWRAVWQGGLTIAGVWVVCSILPRIPARVRCWLWRLAFAKLIVCLLWTAPIKIAVLPAAKPPEPVASRAEPQRLSRQKPSPVLAQVPTSVVESNISQNGTRPSLGTVLLALWAFGVSAGVLGIAGQWRSTRRLIRDSSKLEHEQIETDRDLLAEYLGIRKLPALLELHGLNTPLLAGLRHPQIVMPHSLLDDKSPAQLRMMVAHELAHIKRRDLWWAWLGMTARVLFFFHPLVWLAKTESRLTEEMAADELAVTVCNLKPVDYAGMLVAVAAKVVSSQKEELVVAVVGSHRTLKRRLQAMKHISSSSSRRTIAAAVMVAIIGIGVIVPWRLVAQGQTIGAPEKVDLKSNTASQTNARANLPMEIDSTIYVDAEGRYNYAGRVVELDEAVSELAKSPAGNSKSGVVIQADQKAPFRRLVALLDRMKDAGISRVSISTVSREQVEPQTFNIDFGAWRPEESRQIGPAAAGREGDFWNTVGVAWSNEHTESDLKFASGEPSPIRVEMINLGGGWGNDGRMGVKAPMLDSFNYPVNNQGGNSQVILHEAPPGEYDVYVYGHGTDPLYYGDYTLTVGNHKYGRKTTSDKSDAIEKTAWVEGSQYVKFDRVRVAAGDKVEILIQPGGQVTDHWGRTFADAMICGLQLVPVK